MIKALLFSLVAIGSLAFISAPIPAYAQDFCTTPGAADTDFCKNQSTGTSTNNTIVGPNGILTRIVSILTFIVGIAAVIVVIIGGIMFAVSNGDSGQISKARQAIIYGLVGLVVALFARAIVSFVLNRL